MKDTPQGLLQKISRHLALARAFIFIERIWSRIFIPFCITAVFISLSWFGLFRLLPFWLNYAAIGLFTAAFLYACRTILTLKWPSHDEAALRLEDENKIQHQGISVLTESMDQTDQAAQALWAEHQRRMQDRISNLKAGGLRSDLPDRDPYAVRVLIILILISGFAYSFSDNSGHLQDAFVKPVQTASNSTDIRLDAWVTPPAYVNRAPIFLTNSPENGVISIPEQSRIVVRLSGHMDEIMAPTYKSASGLEIVLSSNKSGPEEAAKYKLFEIAPEQNGILNIKNEWSRKFEIIADKAPKIEFESYPKQAINGAMELTYKAKDDYGIVEATAEIIPVDPIDDHALPLYEFPEFALQLPHRSSKDGTAFTSHDLTEHPLAGQDVLLTLIATDAKGQEARSQSLEITLPQRQFSSLLAQSIIEQRQVLAFDAYDLPRAIELNDALTILPEETIPSLKDYLLIKAAREGLSLANSDEALHDWVDNLWNIALILEDGELSLAEKKLKDAQQALSDALKDGASNSEIAELMDKLREAMDEYLQALAKNNMDQFAQNQPSRAQEMEVQDFNNILDQIENMAKAGNREQAQNMLNNLQNMMNNLQKNGQQQANRQPNPIEDQLEELGQILREQQKLMDETFALDQKQQQQRENQLPNPGQNEQSENEGNSPKQLTEKELAEAMEQLKNRQEALQKQLEQLMEQMEKEGLAPTDGLNEAGDAMGNATGELGEGEMGAAGQQQGRALQALRDGAQQMLNQLQEQMQAQQQGQAGQSQQLGQSGGQGNQRDPLGRRKGGGREGMYGQNPDARFGDANDIQRAREILDIIRKRLGDNFRLDFEKEYLERLLKAPQ